MGSVWILTYGRRCVCDNVWSNVHFYPKQKVRMNIVITWLYNSAVDDKININHPTFRIACTHK